MRDVSHKHYIMMSGRIFRSLIMVCALLVLGACKGHDPATENYQRAEEAFGRGEYRLAEKLYQDYVQQEAAGKKRWEAWQRLVVITRDIGNDSSAASELLETMYLEFRTDPKRALSIRMQQIELYQARGDLEHAVATIDKSLDIPGISSRQQWNLLFTKGTLALRMHRHSLARTSFEAAMEDVFDAESRSRTLYATGQALLYMHEYEQARKILQQTFAETPPGTTWSRIGFALADIAEHQGRYEDGVQILMTIKNSYPNPKVLDIRLQSLQKQIHRTP